ncbi:hypothetical protein [Streptomyces lanatus]|uniref:Uncharacterized protein n=1 Tax=Streptomyces lanatus TaxID=66900 RepID=A0ABV1Y7F8_9ACTN|nr:hypothetical protein [Streptomyces lanatus]GHH26233.1 hypothetical protein GCM10018780_79270 [Streptomyces lanatus]
MVGSGQRREIGAAGRTVPSRDGLAQGKYDAEDDAEHGDDAKAPHGGGAAIGTQVDGKLPRLPCVASVGCGTLAAACVGRGGTVNSVPRRPS